jgi:2-phosphoglycerate kinase
MHRGSVVNNLQNDISALITYDSTLSKNISTMSQSWMSAIQSLVESQTRQQEVIQRGFECHNELVQRGFDRLIACMSHSHNMIQIESASEVVDLLDDFESKEDHHG